MLKDRLTFTFKTLTIISLTFFISCNIQNKEISEVDFKTFTRIDTVINQNFDFNQTKKDQLDLVDYLSAQYIFPITTKDDFNFYSVEKYNSKLLKNYLNSVTIKQLFDLDDKNDKSFQKFDFKDGRISSVETLESGKS